MKVTVMIPALLGSTRIKDKNIFLIDGYPLMYYVIKTAKKARNVNELYINSEENIFHKMAELFDVKFYQRKPEAGGSKCIMENKSMKCNGTRCQVHDHFIYDYLKNIDTDYLIQIHTTSPLISTETIERFVDYLVENNFDSCFATLDLHEETLFNNQPINFSFYKKEMTQTLTPMKSISWAISGWKKESFINSFEEDDINKRGPTFCGEIGFFPISRIEGLDADYPEDLFIIESVLDHMKKKDNFLIHKFNERIVEIDNDLLRLIQRDGVQDVPKLVPNNNNVFTTSLIQIKNQQKGDSWCYPLFYNMNDQICLIKQNKNEGCRKHYHVTKGEWWLVLEGEFKWVMDDGKEYYIKENEMIYLPPGTIHQIFCTSEKPGIRMAGGLKNMEHIYVE